MRKNLLKLQWKICCLLCLASLLSLNVQAQAPNQFSFQGVARDASGKVIANGNVTLWIKINSDANYDGGGGFQEVHEILTNSAGVFNIQIGSAGGDLEDIEWSSGTYFLIIKIDPSGGNNSEDFISLGSTQLHSVPYALVANKLPDLDPIIQAGKASVGKSINTIAAGPSLVWYPRKSAFRVGLSSSQLDDGSFGNGSVSFGVDAIASHSSSVAIGIGTKANVLQGTVLGKFNDIPDSDLAFSPQGRLFQIGNGEPGVLSNALTILNNGNIGIGNNVLNPKYLLDIGGRARIKHANETAGIHFNNSANIESGFIGMKTDDQVGLFIGGSWRFWVNAEGDGFLKGNIIQTSDRRLKRDFSPVTNSLSKLTNLTAQHYFWKDTTKSQELQTGLIAQEVEQYFPELVTTDDKGFKAVNYIGLIPHLIESVKTLKAQTEVIGTLQKGMETMKQMEKEMHELRAELNTMKTATSSNSNNLSK